MKRLHVALGAAVISLLLGIGPTYAKSSGVSSTHSSSSHSSARSSKSRVSSAASSSKSLPAGTQFIRKTCKTAACKANHPSGEYMLPIKPKTAKAPKPAG